MLIDISRLVELDAIRDRGDQIEIGAAVTQNTLMAWPQLAQKLPLVAAALPFVGHFQTRNKGTVCGSVAHADPSSEIPLALAVAGGDGGVAFKKRGERVLAADAFQQDMLTTARAPDELIAAVRFPVIEGKGISFRRSGAPPRRLRHRRDCRHGRQARRGAARRRRHGRAAAGAFESTATLPARSPIGRRSSKATRTCTLRPRCGAICSAILPRCHRGGDPMRRVNKTERVRIALTLNGRKLTAEAEPRMLLSDFLRHGLGATGTHVGCEHGICGACTVLIDGVAARSCLMLAIQAEGREVKPWKRSRPRTARSTRCKRPSATITLCNAASARRAS